MGHSTASTPRAAIKPSRSGMNRQGLIGAVLLVVVGLTGIGLANISLSQDYDLSGREALSLGRGDSAGSGEGAASARRSGLLGKALAEAGEGRAGGGEVGIWEEMERFNEEGGDYQRAMAVKAAMLHAWRSYERYAMGAAELHPVSKTAKHDIMGGTGISGMGVTVVDAMSTLHIMGLKEDFDRARDWLYGSLHFDRSARVSFFETVIRLLGGLVSCYDLSGDKMFLDKATILADRLLVNFRRGGSAMPSNDASLGPERFTAPTDGQVSLATVGSNILEFGSLSLRTGRTKYMVKAEKGIRRLHRCNPHQALLPKNLDLATGEPMGEEFSVGAEADSYFEYMLKYWILTGKQDNHWRRRWVAAADEIMERLVPEVEGDPSLFFTADLRGSSLTQELEHLACFWPGNVALGVIHGAVAGPKAELYLRFAEGMGRACYQLYNSTTTGLGAERVTFDLTTGAATPSHGMYWQRPEVIESIFYLWRATRDPKYREWGWRMFEAFEKYCKQEAGYSGAQDVMQAHPEPDDAQQSWLLAETLKYWYLLFAPDSALSLDDWVLNTEAHPLRVWKPEHAAPPSDDDNDEEVPNDEDPCGYGPLHKEQQRREQQERERRERERREWEAQQVEREGQEEERQGEGQEGQGEEPEQDLPDLDEGQQQDNDPADDTANPSDGQQKLDPQQKDGQGQAGQGAAQQAGQGAAQQGEQQRPAATDAEAAEREQQARLREQAERNRVAAEAQAAQQQQAAAEAQAAQQKAATDVQQQQQEAQQQQAVQQAASEAQGSQQQAVSEAQAAQQQQAQQAAAGAKAAQQKAAQEAQVAQLQGAALEAEVKAQQQQAVAAQQHAEAQGNAQQHATEQKQEGSGAAKQAQQKQAAKQGQAKDGGKALPHKGKEPAKAKKEPKHGGAAKGAEGQKVKDAAQPQPTQDDPSGAAAGQQQQPQQAAAGETAQQQPAVKDTQQQQQQAAANANAQQQQPQAVAAAEAGAAGQAGGSAQQQQQEVATAH